MMNWMADPFFAWSTTIAMGALVLSIVAVFARLVIGPTLADRVVALDMLAFLAIGMIAVTALRAQQTAFLDAALVLALVAFLATVAFARFVERTAMHTQRGGGA